MNNGQRRLILDTIILGIVGALSAQLFMLMLRACQRFFLQGIGGYIAPGLPSEGGTLVEIVGPHWLWLIPVATTLGGLLSGFLVYRYAPEAEGHGTDTAVKAYHMLGGALRSRVPLIKMVASAITIGSGGAAGREGPTALISAGFGSIYATLTHRSEDDRRLLLLIGMAAGLSAIFRSPIGTAIFAIEVLYSGMDFDVGALLYTMLGSIIAYALNGVFVGWKPLFSVPPNLGITNITDYLQYIALGIASGLFATVVPTIFYGGRDLFRKLPIPQIFQPAIGGLGVGLIALLLPQVLGGGYGWIQAAIDGNVAVNLLFFLVFAKMLAFTLTVSSGGSGGVFAPSLYVGAMLGGLLAAVFHIPAAAMVIVGMAAVFGGAARVPMATLLMVTEMTGGYSLLVPAALAVMLSYMIQITLSQHLRYYSLYEGQVGRRADSPAHHQEQVESAIQLINQRGLNLPKIESHLDLHLLLLSGIPIDLPDAKQLVLGGIRNKSIYVNKPLYEVFPVERQDLVDVLAIFRNRHTILPGHQVVLRNGDRLLMIVDQAEWKKIRPNFSPIDKEKGRTYESDQHHPGDKKASTGQPARTVHTSGR
jgi:CIC family chloride channel protein